ncbi:hypothetical protein KI387_044599, partial [Taxus chinensis]
MPSDLEDIAVFLKMGVVPFGMKALEKKKLDIRIAPYMLISGDLYKMGHDEIICQCMLEHERIIIMEEAHGGIARAHYTGN